MSSPGPRHDVEQFDTEKVCESGGEPKFFVGHAPGGDDRDLVAPAELFQLLAQQHSESPSLPRARDELAVPSACGSRRRFSRLEVALKLSRP